MRHCDTQEGVPTVVRNSSKPDTAFGELNRPARLYLSLGRNNSCGVDWRWPQLNKQTNRQREVRPDELQLNRHGRARTRTAVIYSRSVSRSRLLSLHYLLNSSSQCREMGEHLRPWFFLFRGTPRGAPFYCGIPRASTPSLERCFGAYS